MTPFGKHALKRRLRRNQRQTVAPQSISSMVINRGVLETVGLLAQIALVVVAIFGYFYTVQPTYQKERLAEQVAEYDGIIKKQTPKIAETEIRLAELQRQRAELANEIQKERTRLTNELRQVERQLSAARSEKIRIEEQIQFMTFRYRLPDGTPATTPEQVKIAQSHELKRSYASTLFYSCALGYGASAFPPQSYEKYDEKSKAWPFTDKELSAWKEYGIKYPLMAATACINSASAKFAERYGQSWYANEIEGLRKQAIEYANRAAEKPWVPPMQPTEIFQELSAKRSASEVSLKADRKKVEEEYGDWESTFGEARRVLFKHNYEVGIKNAEIQALSRRMSLQYEAQQRANDLRKSISEEIKRLVISDVKSEIKSSR